MKSAQKVLMLAPGILMTVAGFFGMAWALQPLGTADPRSPCESARCFLTPDGKVKFEKEFNCTFKDCHLANGEDICRWAIGEKETGGKREAGGYGYEPDTNPCNKDNEYCAATTGNPASAGRAEFYAASYGTHQITMPKLISWLNPGGKTRFAPPPDCIQKWFLDDKEIMDALKEANKRFSWGQGLVSKVPAATVNADGSISYPAIPKAIEDQAIKLKILRKGDAKSEADWKEMWERMSAWNRLKQIIEAKWKETGGDKEKAWGKNKSGKIIYKNGLGVAPSAEYTTLLARLVMKNSGARYTGIKPYITPTKQWNEAAVAFGNYALFTGAPPNLYTRLTAFFANKDCHLEAVNQMFELKKHGYDGEHDDPDDAATEKWVKEAAGAWNGSGFGGGYAKKVFEFYKELFYRYYGKTEVCN